MIADFHNHTEFSGDCDTPVREQLNQAIALGMKELCITDHHDYDGDFGVIDFNLDIDTYVPAMKALQAEYRNRIDLKIGIELGLQPHLKEYCRQLVEQYTFDFVIGSTHLVDGRDPYDSDLFDTHSEEEAYTLYFENLLANTRIIDDYDVAGHLDYVIRYGPNKNKYYSFDRYRDVLEETLKLLAQKGKGIECNTAGLAKGLGQPNPHPDLLRRYRELGGEIVTIGSDAHVTKNLGYAFDTAAEILKSCGFRYYATFASRKPVFHKL